MTLTYLNQLLSQYPEKSRQTAFEIVGGFQEAIDDIEDINMDDMDEAYNMLYQNLMTMPTFQGIQSRLAAITLAKFFLDKFQYLPTPSIPLIQSSDTSNSLPNAVTQRRSSSLDSNDNLQSRTQPSTLPSSTSKMSTQPSAAPQHNRNMGTSSTRIQSRTGTNEVTTEPGRGISQAQLAADAIHNTAVRNANINPSHSGTLSDAEILNRQRQQMYAAQMAMANAAAATGGHQMVQSTNVARLPMTMPSVQQVTIYGPNGQPGIQTRFPNAIVSIAGGGPIQQVPRAILPRPQMSTSSSTQSAPARHNLPLQVQPNRQPFR